ncbi:putative nicotinamide riboside protein [Apodospora peruviana]|uniref:Nicotinamide riboside protein n=1 Tax=Apodospora peruviana TaxID=516989 RepID=A0AAE0HYN8_9PEZI|nr:putative nicotinamide riboside protein [Apodospora peruviana]
MDNQKAVIVGISGCSSSGKTTLARLLRDIFPHTFILHEDDFYKPEEQLPIKEGLADWDCPEAISIPDMENALSHIRSTGTFPVSLLLTTTTTSTSSTSSSTTTTNTNPTSKISGRPSLSHRHNHGCHLTLTTASSSIIPPPSSDQKCSPSYPLIQPGFPLKQPISSKEDKNTIGQCPVSSAQIDAAKSKVSAWLAPNQPGALIFSRPLKVCLLDGFLLYSPDHLPTIMPLIDIKLFLLVSRAKATQRREARDGYVTLEGFWTDPPGYVDKIVWPNYAAEHAWLFENANVEDETKLDKEKMQRYGIEAQTGKGLDIDFGETLHWAVETIMHELERIVLGQQGGESESK